MVLYHCFLKETYRGGEANGYSKIEILPIC